MTAGDLTNIEHALSGLVDSELRALVSATAHAPQLAPRLLEWIEAACDWEQNRRAGHHCGPLPPWAGIDSSADQISVSAALMLRAAFDSGSSPAVVRLLDALVGLLTSPKDMAPR